MKKIFLMVTLFGASTILHNVKADIINQLDDLKISLDELKNELRGKPAGEITREALIKSEILAFPVKFLKGINNPDIKNAIANIIDSLQQLYLGKVENVITALDKFKKLLKDKKEVALSDIKPVTDALNQISYTELSNKLDELMKLPLKKASINDRQKLDIFLEEIRNIDFDATHYILMQPEIMTNLIRAYKILNVFSDDPHLTIPEYLKQEIDKIKSASSAFDTKITAVSASFLA
jgi:hypothetical protein